MSDYEPVEFQFIALSPDEQEAEARRLPLVRLHSDVASKWHVHHAVAGIQLRLPVGFTRTEVEADGQAAWQREDGSFVAVVMLDGAGEFFVSFAESETDSVSEEEGHFQVPLAGRIGAVRLYHVQTQQQDYYYASANAALREDYSVAVLLAGPTEGSRAELLNVIPTVAVEGNDPLHE